MALKIRAIISGGFRMSNNVGKMIGVRGIISFSFPMCIFGERPEPTDLDPWAWSTLPTVGGAGYAINHQNPRIAGMRHPPHS